MNPRQWQEGRRKIEDATKEKQNSERNRSPLFLSICDKKEAIPVFLANAQRENRDVLNKHKRKKRFPDWAIVLPMFMLVVKTIESPSQPDSSSWKPKVVC